MASQPGPLYEFPWESMGAAKYTLLLPFAASVVCGWDDGDNFAWHMLAIAALRYLHAQAWNTLSRLHAVSARTRIYGKGIDFKQVDREANWDDYILLQVLVMTLVHRLPGLHFGGWPLMNWVRWQPAAAATCAPPPRASPAARDRYQHVCLRARRAERGSCRSQWRPSGLTASPRPVRPEHRGGCCSCCCCMWGRRSSSITGALQPLLPKPAPRKARPPFGSLRGCSQSAHLVRLLQAAPCSALAPPVPALPQPPPRLVCD